jgi:predicted transcriptional regulator
MDIAAKSEQVPDYPLDVSMVAFADMAKILSALGNEDALAIFIYAKNGIESSKDAIRALGLTQKKFYSRLKDLIDNKLIEKHEGEYRHTALGEILLEMGLSMEKLLLSKEQLRVLDSIRRSGNISAEKKSQLSKVLSLELPFFQGKSTVTVATSFEEVVQKTIEYLNMAETRVYFASKYFDIRVVEKIMDLLESGVDMHFLSDKMSSFSEVSKMILSMMFNQKMVKTFYGLLKSSEIKYKAIEDLPYTFIIVDGKHSMFEVRKPFTRQFLMAFFFEDEDLSRKLIECFEIIWDTAEPVKMGLLKKGESKDDNYQK